MAGRTAAAAVIAGCFHNPPDIGGKPSAPTMPDKFWAPPKDAIRKDSITPAALPADVESRLQNLTLADIVDVALRNNPATQASYANARVAGATFGASEGAYYPQVTIGGVGQRIKVVTGSSSKPDTIGVPTTGIRDNLQPTATISWLLLDVGGRQGSIDAAKEATFVASYTHNATVQNVVLQAESAYFTYNAAKALLEADKTTLQEDSTNLASTQARHNVGVATIADVLQAQTVLSQQVLIVEGDSGNVLTARGGIALALGLPATTSYDIQAIPPTTPIGDITDRIDTLVQTAIRDRPDLAALRSQIGVEQAGVTQARSSLLPTLSFNATGGSTYSDQILFTGVSYTLTLQLSMPLFTGFTNQWNLFAAQERVKAAKANAEALKQTVIYQVVTDYAGLQTATQRVRSADALLQSAQQSEEVAAGQYKEGVGTIVNLLTAQAALAAARAQQVQARWTWYTALVQLSHDAGTLEVHGGAPIHVAPDPSKLPPR
jgi:outer membrane protein TolC